MSPPTTPAAAGGGTLPAGSRHLTCSVSATRIWRLTERIARLRKGAGGTPRSALTGFPALRGVPPAPFRRSFALVQHFGEVRDEILSPEDAVRALDQDPVTGGEMFEQRVEINPGNGLVPTQLFG